MWYKKALDLNELNREFKEEQETAIEDWDDAMAEEKSENIKNQIFTGESYTSPAGTIRVNPDLPKDDNKYTIDEIDSNFFSSNDRFDVYDRLKTKESSINKFIDLAKTLNMYIFPSSDVQNFIENLMNVKNLFKFYSNKYRQIIDDVEKKWRNSNYEYDEIQYVQDDEIEKLRNLEAAYTKLINDMYAKIKNTDAKQEWLYRMAIEGLGGNFLTSENKEAYLEVLNRIYYPDVV